MARLLSKKVIGRRATVNRTGNKSSGKVKAQELYNKATYLLRVKKQNQVNVLSDIPVPQSTDYAVGVYIKTSNKKTIHVTIDAEVFSSNEWGIDHSIKIKIDNDWKIAGAFVSPKKNISKMRLRFHFNNKGNVYLWGYQAGTIEDLVPSIEKDIREQDPEIDEEKLQFILKTLVQKNRLKYIETAYLDHENDHLKNSAGLTSTSLKIQCKYCTLCERLLPVVSFHKHSMFASGYQLECKGCKNCNINPKLNYLRTKQQLLESSLIRREFEVLAKENEWVRKNPDIIKELFNKFDNKCFNCGVKVDRRTGHVDHTRPLVALWPLDKHATILCSQCNNEKHDKFPIEFYKDKDKRIKLANITGLSIGEIEETKVNPSVLKIIMRDVNNWYKQLKEIARRHQDINKTKSIPDRSFRAVARRVKKLNGVDLYELYQKQTGRSFPGQK